MVKAEHDFLNNVKGIYALVLISEIGNLVWILVIYMYESYSVLFIIIY